MLLVDNCCRPRSSASKGPADVSWQPRCLAQRLGFFHQCGTCQLWCANQWHCVWRQTSWWVSLLTVADTIFWMTHTHTHTHLMALYSGLPGWAGTKRVKPIGIRDFTEARDSECQWHQVGHMQVCNSLQTDNHASTTPLIFLPAGCPSCCPTTSIKTLKAHLDNNII